MNVLSLFDGISCGMVALERAGIPVERYVAYEIEEDAIKVSKQNYPQIEHKGDVFEAEYSEDEFDLLIGGSPCTYWSVLRGGRDREITASGVGWNLFSQYVRALREAKPKYFLYENNSSMSNDIKDCISIELGCEPIEIDSADFSAQHRKRFYWTNIPISSWEKSTILFSDILDTTGKYRYKFRDFSKYADTVKISEDGMNVRYDTSGKGHYGHANRAKKPSQKWNTLVSGGSNTKNDIWFDDFVGRHLTPLEMERLQTLPDGYTSCLNSDIKSMKVCGNGWTVDVIAHILKGIKEKENKELELKMNEYQLPGQILFNYDELKQELTEKVSMYETLVYTDDQIQEAKKDKANLNKLKKALNDERIRREKEYMVPFNDFKTKINEIISIIDKPVAVIDKQVKAYEDKQKQDKLDAITEFFNGTEHPEWLHLSKIMDEKWLNASVSMKSVKEAIESRLDQIEIDLTTLHDLPEFAFEASTIYETCLDMNKAIYEAQKMSQMAKAKAEAEAKKAEEEFAKNMNPPVSDGQLPGQIEFKDAQTFDAVVENAKPVEVEKHWVKFQALLSTEDALALRDFFNSRNIDFKAI